MKNTQRGFTLLIALIFMSVMLAIGLALSSLAYKQQVLASSAIESQYAFYAADAGLECALYFDQGEDSNGDPINAFAYPQSDPGSAPPITCDGNSPVVDSRYTNDTYNNTEFVVRERIPLYADTRCIDITVYKPNPLNQGPPTTNYIFSQGYDVPCETVGDLQAGARIVSRGINIHY